MEGQAFLFQFPSNRINDELARWHVWPRIHNVRATERSLYASPTRYGSDVFGLNAEFSIFCQVKAKERLRASLARKCANRGAP